MAKKEELENLNFEQAMAKLETITTELEKGELDLDASVSKFEEGMQLSKKCSELLDNAEKRITILLKDGENIREENFTQEEE
ncbi:MAG: exodeoxyribonuclease VII small subunit [Clostridia bacterium]